MHAALSLHELQHRFMAALYDDAQSGPTAMIAGNGVAPEARLRIYRHSCNETQIAALRTTYPAVLALVGDAFFDQAAEGYRRKHPSRSGNLQAFGDAFAEYLANLRGCRALPYLPDVARLEWLRQQTVLAPDASSISPEAIADVLRDAAESTRIVLHPSLHRLESRYPVLTIWNYALRPTEDKLTLDNNGERVVLWRDDGEVAMGAVDPSSFACIASVAQGMTLGEARLAAQAIDDGFDLEACLESLVTHGLVIGVRPFPASCAEPPPCR